MNTIEISTQEELDALPVSFPEFTIIRISNTSRTLMIKYSYGNASAELYGNASARLHGNASARLHGNASAELYDNASAELYDNASARLYDNASARLYDNASARLYGNASAGLHGNASARLHGNASARLHGNASAELYGNASARLHGNASARLHGNASAELYGNASAELYDNASARLYDNASARLYDNAIGRSFSDQAVINALLDNAILQAIDIDSVTVNQMDSTATVVYAKTPPASLSRLKSMYSDQCTENGIYLYKVTDDNHMDHYTGSIRYEGVVVCPDFDQNPDRECGGALHLSPRPHMARRYSDQGPMHKCFVLFEHIVVHPNSHDKVRCSQVEVIGRCDEQGNLIETEAAA